MSCITVKDAATLRILIANSVKRSAISSIFNSSETSEPSCLAAANASLLSAAIISRLFPNKNKSVSIEPESAIRAFVSTALNTLAVAALVFATIRCNTKRCSRNSLKLAGFFKAERKASITRSCSASTAGRR